MLAVPDRLRHPVAGLRAPLLALRGPAAWPWVGALGPLLLALMLGGFRLEQEGYGNLYYAAGVQSMLQSWHNLFFAAFDPAGFVTLDKPPMGFWVQAASAKLLGFGGLALLLPQVLAGVAAVGLLYYLVGRAFGWGAGFLAALLLALTPISIATSRNNTIDSLLVLVVLLAAGATLRAVETGRARWLLGAAALVGIGFNVKMLEAYLVLPALYLVYLLAGPRRWPARVLHLAAATAVLLVVSLSWAVAVDLTPPEARPYVGSSTHNSVLELMIWHNGLSRVLPGQPLFGGPVAPGAAGRARGQRPPAQDGPPGPGAETAFGGRLAGGFGIGAPGPLRLFAQPLGSQIGWLLPLALLSLAVIGWDLRRAPGDPRARASSLLWGTWLLTVGAFFSATRQFQPYYLVMLAPAIAALGGAGLAVSWRAFGASRPEGWLLPLVLGSSVLGELALLDSFPDWSARLTPWIAALALASLAALAGGRWVPWLGRQRVWLPAAATVGLVALLAAPAVWASAPAWAGMGPRPLANPVLPGAPGRGAFSSADSGAAAFLTAHQDRAAFLAATLNANTAAPLILATGAPVMAVGGFSGADPILSPEQFAARVAAGDVRYALFPAEGERAGGGPLGGRGQQQALVGWVQESCAPVPSAAWQANPPASRPDAGARGRNGAATPGAGGRFGPGGVPTLYDCATVAAGPSGGG